MRVVMFLVGRWGWCVAAKGAHMLTQLVPTCVLGAWIVSIWVVEGLCMVPVLSVVVRGGLDRVSRCEL
jgi:hypothetical protein